MKHSSIRHFAFSVTAATMTVAGTASHAADVDFIGNVLNTCILTVDSTGLLGLSPNGQTLGSEEIGGAPAVLAVVSTGANNVTVNDGNSGAGFFQSKPAGYTDNADISIKYSGLAGLNAVNQDYTNQESDFNIGALPLSVLTFNAKAEDPAGFTQGSYTIRTIVTCAP